MSDFLSWLTTDRLQNFSILMLCFCIVMFGRAVDRHNNQIFKLQREMRELTRRCNGCAYIHSSHEEQGVSRRKE